MTSAESAKKVQPEVLAWAWPATIVWMLVAMNVGGLLDRLDRQRAGIGERLHGKHAEGLAWPDLDEDISVAGLLGLPD